jgi:hypothetical protein
MRVGYVQQEIQNTIGVKSVLLFGTSVGEVEVVFDGGVGVSFSYLPHRQ